MKKLLNGIKSLLSDERGAISSKRVVGIICALFLCLTLYKNSCDSVSTPLVESVAALSAACLGLTSLDKIFGKVQGQPPKE